MDKPITYGMDEPMRLARTISIASEKEADDVFAQADGHVLPVGYIVKAVIHCNQLDTFRMVACDWSVKVEARRESIEGEARKHLVAHFRHAHPYLGRAGMSRLLRATQMNFRDFGR